MTRKQAVELYTILRELKNGSMSKEGITAFILMNLKLLKQIFLKKLNLKILKKVMILLNGITDFNLHLVNG